MSDSRHPARLRLHTPSCATRRPQRGPSIWLLSLLVLIWSVGLGWGLAGVGRSQSPNSSSPNPSQASHIGTVDPIPERYQTGQALYLEACASCHIGVPPAVFPTETWRDLLLDENHYGQRIDVLPSPQIHIVWDYLQTFSRPNSASSESVPFRFQYSRPFAALHPNIDVPRPLDLNSCRSCHPQVDQFDIRRLSSDWE
ncbi:diheme cytochrome C [Phormidium willei BDU 130791]|nr:diheme cytochrome C [Phormidium willei BDU 130791]